MAALDQSKFNAFAFYSGKNITRLDSNAIYKVHRVHIPSTNVRIDSWIPIIRLSESVEQPSRIETLPD